MAARLGGDGPSHHGRLAAASHLRSATQAPALAASFGAAAAERRAGSQPHRMHRHSDGLGGARRRGQEARAGWRAGLPAIPSAAPRCEAPRAARAGWPPASARSSSCHARCCSWAQATAHRRRKSEAEVLVGGRKGAPCLVASRNSGTQVRSMPSSSRYLTQVRRQADSGQRVHCNQGRASGGLRKYKMKPDGCRTGVLAGGRHAGSHRRGINRRNVLASNGNTLNRLVDAGSTERQQRGRSSGPSDEGNRALRASEWRQLVPSAGGLTFYRIATVMEQSKTTVCIALAHSAAMLQAKYIMYIFKLRK